MLKCCAKGICCEESWQWSRSNLKDRVAAKKAPSAQAIALAGAGTRRKYMFVVLTPPNGVLLEASPQQAACSVALATQAWLSHATGQRIKSHGATGNQHVVVLGDGTWDCPEETSGNGAVLCASVPQASLPDGSGSTGARWINQRLTSARKGWGDCSMPRQRLVKP
jgi:hypothetical protein